MPIGSMHGATLRASISAIENGLFHATYRTTKAASDTRQLPAYQVGASVSDARREIEQSAHLLGYETVVWDRDFNGPSD